MAPRKIAILGSTGSIGRTALSLAQRYPDHFQIVALAGGRNIGLLAQQVQRFRPALVSTQTTEGLVQLRELTGALAQVEYGYGVQGAQAVASFSSAEVVLSAMVGAAGLRPTLAAVEAGKTVALANKESLVVAGALISQRAKEMGSLILPVDSEHSAVFQALHGRPLHEVRRLILTASGGPFFFRRDLDLSRVTSEQALKHPRWTMGEKITIDSATLMNKGLEIVEAHWLFGIPIQHIDALVHPQSIIHSMVEYVDGSVLAQLSVPDMSGPIALALHHPHRLPQVMKPIDFSELGRLEFFDLDHDRFPAITLARTAVQMGETGPAVLNGANEVTVRAFLAGQIGFLDIGSINQRVLHSYQPTKAHELEDYIRADEWGRQRAVQWIEEPERKKEIRCFKT